MENKLREAIKLFEGKRFVSKEIVSVSSARKSWIDRIVKFKVVIYDDGFLLYLVKRIVPSTTELDCVLRKYHLSHNHCTRYNDLCAKMKLANYFVPDYFGGSQKAIKQ